MKFFLSGLLSGSLLISGCVVATKGSLAGMLLLGFIVGLTSMAVCWARVHELAKQSKRLFKSVPSTPIIQRAHAPKPVSVIGSEKSANPKRKGRKLVPSPESMLPLVQQEVLSTLMNLGMGFKQAEQAVREAASQKSGESFDELFRLAVGLGKAKRAA